MNIIRKSKTIGFFSLGFSVVIYAFFCIFVSGVTTDQAFAYGSMLTNAEMANTFGDGCSCQKTYKCSQGFTSGANNCGFCDTNSNQERCCSDLGSTGDECTYGTTDACGTSADWKVGERNGSASTCSSCNPSSASVDGKCALKDAENDSDDCS